MATISNPTHYSNRDHSFSIRWPNMDFCYYYLHYLISKGTQIKEVRRIKKKRDDLSPYNIQLDITTGGSNLKPIWNWYVVFEL